MKALFDTDQTAIAHEYKSVADMANHLSVDVPEPQSVRNQILHHLTLDSRQVDNGDCFIAIQGTQCHGLDFLKSVLAKQPGLVVSDCALTAAQEKTLKAHNTHQNELKRPVCNFWVIPTLSNKLGDLASWFYDAPSTRVKVIGITGTNGKTSTAFYTAQLLNQLGQKTALIGTLGNGVFGQLQSTLNTTPDVVSVHRLLSQFIAWGAQWVVMEVSSHAVALDRIHSVEFRAVALTQVTRDHLDFHGSVEAYQHAKMQLFTDYKAQCRIVNIEDSVGLSLFNRGLDSVYTYAPAPNKNAQLTCEKVKLLAEGLQLDVKQTADDLSTPYGESLSVPLMGAFNAENVLCASAILLNCLPALKGQLEALSPLLTHLEPVSGRMQAIKCQSQSTKVMDLPFVKLPRVIVDFAHSPDALKQVLSSVVEHLNAGAKVYAKIGEKAGQLWVVFGCGGDRDQGKRVLMARMAETYADHVMVTDDNPRFERSEDIIAHIMQGFESPERVLCEPNRKMAIERVLNLANERDVVVIAGKGHECYQDVLGIKQPFSDVEIAQNWLCRSNPERSN